MRGAEFRHLFTPIKIRSMTVKNRLFMPPMCTDYATIRGDVTERLVAYYVERALGGVGLITVEFTAVSPEGKIFKNMTGLYDDEAIPGYRKLTTAVHEAGAKIAIQLSHAGRRTHSSVTGETPVAPSPIPRLNGEVPRELTIGEIQKLIEDFAKAAFRAKEAGFDAVMIHMAHGYLINQFLSPLSNKRHDAYGGDLEGRSRFAMEIVRRTRQKLGQDLPITCRLCGDEYLESGFGIEESTQVAENLEKAGIDAIDVSAGTHETDHILSAPSCIPPGFLTSLSEKMKKVVGVPVGIVGRINGPEVAEQVLAEKKADFVSMGRALIADPELPVKTMAGKLDDIRPCTACNTGCNDRMYNHLDVSCQTNPMVGRELYFRIEPALEKKRVLIVGAGPAGLEAARVAALRGHDVFLFEKEQRVGGQLNLATMPPGKTEYAKLVRYYEHQMTQLKVNLIYAAATSDEIDRIKPDVLIFATGGRPYIPEGISISGECVCTAWDILRGNKTAGERIVIVGGGQVGCETADFLLEKGKKMTILERLSTIAGDMSSRGRKLLLKKLIESGVDMINEALVTQISDSEITFERAGLKQKVRGFDQVVLALGTAPENGLLEEIRGAGHMVKAVGDCVRPRRTLEAIREGFETALEL